MSNSRRPPEVTQLCTFTNGHGVSQPVSDQSMQYARQLMAVEAPTTATDTGASEAALPVGSDWPLMRIVTADGLVSHLVQPHAADAVDHRDPSSLAGTKRRAGEE